MGQLQLYQWALEEQEPERQLFLAISQAIYTRHFQKPIAILNQLKESRRVHEGAAAMHRFPPRRKWCIPCPTPCTLPFSRIISDCYIFQLALKRNKINLLVYEPDQEVILQWKTH